MFSTLRFVLGLATVVNAVPSSQEHDGAASSKEHVKRQDESGNWEGILDPWGEYGQIPTYLQGQMRRSQGIEINPRNANLIDIGGTSYQATELLRYAKRADVRDFTGMVPKCSDDPSYAPVKPDWAVDAGIKIPRHGDKDECDSGKSVQDHCWTEYRLVEYAIEYMNWQATGTVLDCSDEKGSTCSVSVADLKQTCSIVGKVTTEGWDQKVADVSLGLTIGKESWPVKPDLGYSASWSKTKTVSESDLLYRCAAETTTVQCTWEVPDVIDEKNKDQLCHQVWYADRIMHVFGQAVRKCNKCTNGNVQQNSGDGTYCVRGQKEFDFIMPINKLVSCRGKCGDLTANVPMPPNSERFKYEEPPTWDHVIISNPLKPGE